MRGKILLFISLVFVFGCKRFSQEEPYIACSMGFETESYEFYEQPVGGLSCSEFQKRRTTTYTDSCELNSSPAQPHNDETNESIENALVPGGLEGTNIALTSGHKLSIQNGYLVHSLLNDTKVKYLSFSRPKSVLSYKDQFLVFGTNKLALLNSQGDQVWSKEFSGGIKSFLRKDQLIIFESKYEPESESECERILYVNNSKWQTLTKIFHINLQTLEVKEKEEIFYGYWQPHVDRSSEYLIGQSWTNTQLFKIAEETYFKNMNGRIVNKTTIREFDEELHIIEEVSNSLGARYVVLDEKLENLQSLDIVAPGEFVKAAHFTDDLVYFATFLETDPLFLIDPKNPQYLSELSYPGDPLHLQEVGEYIISLNRDNGWRKSKLNLINKNDLSNIYIQDVLTLNSSLTGFEYLDFVVFQNFIFIKSKYDGSYLIKVESGELQMIEELPEVELGYFINNRFHYLQGEEWKEYKLKGKPSVD